MVEALRPIEDDPPAAGAPPPLILHPAGIIEVRQTVTPLDTTLAKVGNAPVAGYDRFRIDSLHGSVDVPYRRFRGNLVVTHEWTPLEPDVRDRKYYARGIGVVREESIRGGNETNSLVSFSRGR